jgi:hypothetical protein
METQTKTTESERQLNLGIPVTLKKLGDVHVKELGLEDIVKCAKELATLVSVIDFGKKIDGGEMLAIIMSEPATLQALKVFAAASCDRQPGDFDNMGPADWLRIAIAVKEVNDWEELAELFRQTGLAEKMFSAVQAKKTKAPPILSQT